MTQPILQSSPKASYEAHKAEIDDSLRRVLDSGWYVLGQEGREFEREFAAYLGAGRAVGVGNGTDALQIALRALGVAAGDAVVTVSHTATATVAAISQIGAHPMFVDIDPARFTLSPQSLEDTLRRLPPSIRPKALIAVHLYGQMADMSALREIANRWDLRVVEDAAQAHGAALAGQKAGTWGDISTFSFYPTKNLGALGDGGAIVTNDAELASQARLLREYGWRERYVSAIAGGNSRLDEMQAGVLRVKLKHLNEDNAQRRKRAAQYLALLETSGLGLPHVAADAQHAWHQFVVRTPRRDELRAFLAARGISTLVHYPVPIHRQPAYAQFAEAELPHTEAAAREVLSLPLYPELPMEAVETVAARINEWARA